MVEKMINIQEYCGADRVSRSDGLALRKWIRKELNKQTRLIFDFDNILIASVSFLDEAFAKLASEYGEKELIEKLRFKNIRSFDRAMLNDLFSARLKEKKLKEEARFSRTRSPIKRISKKLQEMSDQRK